MLHQTLPAFFQFNSSSSPHNYYPLQQVEEEMEGKAMMKTSFWPEMTHQQQQMVSEDVWGGGNVGGGNGGDDFFVDQLLNLSKEEDGFVVELEEEKEDFVSVSSHEEDPLNSNAFSKHEFDSLPASELSVPTDDLADLEWLSQFVDDSFTDLSLPSFPTKPQPQIQTQTQTQTQTHNLQPSKSSFSSLKTGTFPAPIPVKPRTKRSRTGGRIGSMGSTTSSSSSPSAASSSTSGLIFNNGVHQNLDLFYCLTKQPLEKKHKKRHVAESGGIIQQQRRCSHCGVQKTPQWRTGPMGAKTLCNACGVRYKSGRLLPEYRPACSPTFSNEVHSNNHRKVLEMRRKKEMVVGPEAGLGQTVQSF